MKKILLLALMSTAIGFAQEEPTRTVDTLDISNRRNEIRTDLVGIVYYSKFNLTYERYLQKKWSVGITGGFSSSKKIDDDFDRGYRNYRPTYDITPFVRYRLSQSPRNFYFAEVFVSANGGDFKETVRRVEEGIAYYVNEKSTYFDMGIGGGLGYKFYFKDQFAVELLVSFGANLLDTEKSPDVLSRTGLSIGYRF